MKKLNLYLVAILLMMMPVWQSCDDDDEYVTYTISMATVRIESGNNYYLELDNGRTLWPVSTNVSWYKPVGGQRVIANCTLVSEDIENYDYGVHVNFLRNVLTKPVEELTEENEEEIGDDPVYVYDMWIGGNYLNVRFGFRLPVNTPHRVSLVENTLAETPDDGYLHLEYRYNDFDDVTPYERYAMVSFNLVDEDGEAIAEKEDGYKGIKVRINSAVNGEKELTFDFPEPNDPANTKEIANPDQLEEGKIR